MVSMILRDRDSSRLLGYRCLGEFPIGAWSIAGLLDGRVGGDRGFEVGIGD